MLYTTLITPEELQVLQRQPAPCMVFDCSADLMQPEQGAAQHHAQRVAGAVFADLNAVLSTHVPGAGQSGGRHPLPARETLAAWLNEQGFAANMQAVVYDRNGGNFCVRLWWLLKWLGHDAVAVLDGGLTAWACAGGACETGASDRLRSGAAAARAAQLPLPFVLSAPLVRVLEATQVQTQLGRNTQTLVDARTTPRYRGEFEPLDRMAGHIPGALNRPFAHNFDAEGRFKTPAQLHSEWAALLGGRAPETVVHYCGSGVSATPNVLALELAGFGRTALYAGSWSDWCGDPARPVAQSVRPTTQ
jgi:thiosulfate/3-mercaptopyruvate sulfurtransferase